MDLINAVNTAKNGNNAGFTYLYESTYQKSYYVALKFLKNEQLAMDVLQDSYIKAFKSLDQLVDASKFEPWFNRIVATRSLNELKKNNPLLFSEMESDGEDNSNIVDFEDDRVEARPDLAIDQKETSRLVKEIMADLSDEQRMCITMFYMEEMSVKEIAEVLGVSENTVKSRLNYGRNKIKEKVLELEKKGTKLYGVLPFVFFLTLFKKEALACEVVVPTIETVLGANATVTTQTAASAGSAGVNSTATAATVAKAGFSIAGIKLSAKALVASVAVLAVVGGGVFYGVNHVSSSNIESENLGALNTSEDPMTNTENEIVEIEDDSDIGKYLFIDFYENGEFILFSFDEVDGALCFGYSTETYNEKPSSTDEIEMNYIAKFNLEDDPHIYVKSYSNNLWLVCEGESLFGYTDKDGNWVYDDYALFRINSNNDELNGIPCSYYDDIPASAWKNGGETDGFIYFLLKESNFDFTNWVDITEFIKDDLTLDEAYDFSIDHNSEWTEIISSKDEDLIEILQSLQ